MVSPLLPSMYHRFPLRSWPSRVGIAVLVVVTFVWSLSASPRGPSRPISTYKSTTPIKSSQADVLGLPINTPTHECARTMIALANKRQVESMQCPAPDRLKAAFEKPERSMPITREDCLFEPPEQGHRLDWSESYIEDVRESLRKETYHGPYGFEAFDVVRGVLNDYSHSVSAKVGLVLGTEKEPWLEALSLNAGAREVWSFDLTHIVSTHPQVKALPYRDIALAFLDKSDKLPSFDFVASFGFLDSAGLGRYGDHLNPDGDVEGVAQVFCFLKPGGLLFLGVPMSCEDNGEILFNARRIYGYQRLRFITFGLEFLGFAGGSCRKNEKGWIAVFRKPGPVHDEKGTGPDPVYRASASHSATAAPSVSSSVPPTPSTTPSNNATSSLSPSPATASSSAVPSPSSSRRPARSSSASRPPSTVITKKKKKQQEEQEEEERQDDDRLQEAAENEGEEEEGEDPSPAGSEEAAEGEN